MLPTPEISSALTAYYGNFKAHKKVHRKYSHHILKANFLKCNIPTQNYTKHKYSLMSFLKVNRPV